MGNVISGVMNFLIVRSVAVKTGSIHIVEYFSIFN